MKKTILVAALAAIAFTIPARTDPWPHRKPGLWQTTMTMQGVPRPPMTSKYCVDEATESYMMNQGQGMMQQSCPTHDVHVMGGRGTIDMVCKFGSMTQTSHTLVTFTGNAAYHSETKSHMTPPMPYGKADQQMSVDATWTGPCPPDMKPGDIVMANGMRMHMGQGMMGGTGRMGGMHMGSGGH